MFRAVILASTLLLIGCATLHNTPQQDYAWFCIDACRAEIPPQCQVTKVTPEGQITSLCMGTLTNNDNFDRCLQTKAEEQPYAMWLQQRRK